MLLVTSSRRPDNWIVPGGGVEPNEEPACTAVREVLEEAGVVGTLGRCLGMFEVFIPLISIEHTLLLAVVQTKTLCSINFSFVFFFLCRILNINIERRYL